MAENSTIKWTASNVRLGFATNSSSSHSVVLGPGAYSASQPEYAPGAYDFGWESFSLSGSAERYAYLAAGVLASLGGFPKYQQRAIISELFKGTPLAVEIYDKIGSEWHDIYIDHQSAFVLPMPSNEHFPSVVKEAMEFFADDRVTILGGNDNDDSGFQGDFALGDEHSVIRIRRDGDNYVIFNWKTGAKMRIAPTGKSYTKAGKPELVDIKITNACPYRCSFCYQGSTPAGASGDSNRISDAIGALGINGLGVFEVAIGGGEPTAEDYFPSVIDICLANYIKPNFTTFAVDWLLDERKVEAANKCGGIGVSVHTVKDIAKVEKIKAKTLGPQVIGQHVYGTLPSTETVNLISEFDRLGLPLLLLGYKQVGFGADKTPHKMDDVIGKNGLREWNLNRIRLSVDTAFVNQHPEFLDFIAANKKSVSRVEGAFSMYVDAVDWKVGPSSYCPAEALRALPDVKREWNSSGPSRQLVGSIQDAFSSYPGEEG